MLKIFLIYTIISLLSFGKTIDGVETLPIFPAPTRYLLKSGTINSKIECNVIVPLEIISDIHIKALIYDNEEVEIHFELELNKKPERKNMYKINFSSKKIDIDKDGKIDTEIFVNKNILSQNIYDNIVKITGKNISKEGTHRKRVYITVEVND